MYLLLFTRVFVFLLIFLLLFTSAHEFVERFKKGGSLPMLASACPGMYIHMYYVCIICVHYMHIVYVYLVIYYL